LWLLNLRVVGMWGAVDWDEQAFIKYIIP